MPTTGAPVAGSPGPRALDEQAQRRLWDLSAERTGVEYSFTETSPPAATMARQRSRVAGAIAEGSAVTRKSLSPEAFMKHLPLAER